MIFDGLSLRHALGLCNLDETYYNKNKVSIINSVFKESFICTRFTLMLVDNLKKSHTTYGYILRSFYSKAQDIYDEIVAHMNENNVDTMKLFSSASSMHMQSYYDQVSVNIIIPLMKQYGIFSPNLIFMIFIELYTSMLIDYEHNTSIRHDLIKYYKTFPKNYTTNISKTIEKIESLDWIGETQRGMMLDELRVWNSIKARS